MTIRGPSDWELIEAEGHCWSCPEPTTAPGISATSTDNPGGGWRYGSTATTGHTVLAKLEGY